MSDGSSTATDPPPPEPATAESDFIAQSEAPARNFAVELLLDFLHFLTEEKKWWLIPILVSLALIALVALLLNSPAAPFIYPLF